MICYMCKQDTIIDDGYTSSWKLDCLHCLEFNKLVTCSFTNYKRTVEQFRYEPHGAKKRLVGEWELHKASVYYYMPERPNDMFILEFNLTDNRTTLTRIGDADTGTKKIYTFDKIMDINLDNLIAKTKMTLTFS
jgi:hypothetical protein